MKRFTLVLMLCLTVIWSLPALAEERIIEKDRSSKDKEIIIEIDPEPKIDIYLNLVHEKHDPRKFALDWYKNRALYGMGFKFNVYSDYFSTLNCEYDANENDLLFSLGGQYRIPKRILFWHFYFGGEYTFSRNNLSGIPYVTMGTDFLVFFSEVKYPLTPNENPVYRNGFRYHF